MSKFKEHSDLMPKTKWGQLKKLSRNVRAARREMYAAERRITSFMEEYNLDTGKRISGDCCITKFNRVCLDAPNTAHIDDSGYVVYCPLFSSTDFCANNKCEWHAANMNYITAVDRYGVARQKRRDFIKGLFRSK